MHESLRTSSKFPALCKNFENLANLKARRGSKLPWLELHFLMTRANLGDFPDLIKLGASLGANEVVATNLTYAPNTHLDQMHVFGQQPLPEDIQIIDQAKKNAEELGIPLRIYPIQAEPHTMVCDADPINTVFINHLGEVTPCVYLGFAVQGQIPRSFLFEAHPFEAVSFGNVRNGLIQALQGEERRAFISAFAQRKTRNVPLAMINLMTDQSDSDELPAPPVPCQHCYKMLGV